MSEREAAVQEHIPFGWRAWHKEWGEGITGHYAGPDKVRVYWRDIYQGHDDCPVGELRTTEGEPGDE